jgi:hypothetical protein
MNKLSGFDARHAFLQHLCVKPFRTCNRVVAVTLGGKWRKCLALYLAIIKVAFRFAKLYYINSEVTHDA